MKTLLNYKVGLQITELCDIPEGDFKLSYPVLIKNITESPIKMYVRTYDNEDFIWTMLYPGWNVELIMEIKDVQPNTLQYGR